MSGNDDKDDLELFPAIPVFDPATSKFEWQEKQMKSPAQSGWTTYGFEVEGGMGFIADGVRVGGRNPVADEDGTPE